MTKEMIFRNITLNDIHLVKCIISSIKRNYKKNESIKILDVGCGSGDFLLYMVGELSKTFPEMELDFYAFDLEVSELTFKVVNSCDNHLSVLIKTLKSKYTNIDWDEKIKLIKENSDWHHTDNFFDIIVSNQVLEHVMNKELFFSKLNKFLKLNGNSFHLAPVSTNVWEYHVDVPFAHWIKSKKNLKRYIIIYKLITSPLTFLNKYEMVMDKINDNIYYLSEKTDYCTANRFIKYCDKHKLTVNLKYTYPYYLMKVCQLIRIDVNKFDFYKCNRFIHYLTFFICKRLASITLHIHR
jgi:2-polyprenyl-3-methyl-5-hydroxy-6-metoxy-1,4-benzoquinol methylase